MYPGATSYLLKSNDKNSSKQMGGNSWYSCTYVCVGSLICPRAGKRDEFMAPLVDHKTANCTIRKTGRDVKK